MSSVRMIAVALLFAPLSTAGAAEPDAAKTKLGVVYKTVEKLPLRLDLHYPEVPKPKAKYPLVVFTHGGGWSAGSRDIGDRGVRFRGVSELNAQGFCVASADYRLCDKDGTITIRECVTDCKDALRYLAKNADRLSLDADRVFTFGDSAGGHLAQMLLLTPCEAFPGDPELANAKYRLVAGVSWYGPCDFEKTDLFNPDGRADFRDRFGPRIIRATADEKAKLAAYREVSPVNYLTAKSPPLLMVQGDKDPTIPVHHAHYMKKRADAVKAPVEVLIVANAAHNWREQGGTMRPTLNELVESTAQFLKKELDRSQKR